MGLMRHSFRALLSAHLLTLGSKTTFHTGHKAPPPSSLHTEQATGIIPSPRSIMSWLFQLPPHFGVPEGLKKQSSEQGLGNLPWDAVSKRAVRAPKAFLGNPKELIHFVREGKKKKKSKSGAGVGENQWVKVVDISQALSEPTIK